MKDTYYIWTLHMPLYLREHLEIRRSWVLFLLEGKLVAFLVLFCLVTKIKYICSTNEWAQSNQLAGNLFHYSYSKVETLGKDFNLAGELQLWKSQEKSASLKYVARLYLRCYEATKWERSKFWRILHTLKESVRNYINLIIFWPAGDKSARIRYL